jgi:hypothetical protein
VNDRNQFLSCLSPRIIPGRSLIDHMLTDMIFDHLCDEAIERTSA